VVPDEQILSAAVAGGDHLLAHAQRLNDGLAWPAYFPATAPLTGLAHGASGIGWALLELAARTGDGRFRDAALQAFKYEDSWFSAEHENWPDFRKANEGAGQTFMVGWCHGAPGITLARLRARQSLDDGMFRPEIAAGLQTTLAQGFRGDHSLCHGSLGNIEPLLQATRLLAPTPWSGSVERASTAVLDDIHEHGWSCGVPLGVETPGLMTGLAGIGYGLLRLAEPAAVPAVLLLDPPVPEGASGSR